MSEYGIWLSFNNQEEGFQLPITPGRIEISDGNKGTTYDISNLGEINVIKDRKLTTYRFNSFFPAPGRHDHLLSTNLILPPKRYVEYIEKWMNSKRPIRFVFTGSTFDINVAASIESFEWGEVAGSIGDIEYSLSLKKYVFYSAKRVKIEPEATEVIIMSSPSNDRPNDRVPPSTYNLVSGDTLWTVAKSQLGDGNRWKEIQSLNGISDADLKRLPVGKVLKLPNVRGTA